MNDYQYAYDFLTKHFGRLFIWNTWVSATSSEGAAKIFSIDSDLSPDEYETVITEFLNEVK